MSKLKKYKSNYRSKNGITLVALVVTIIIMLILAGITLNLTIGNKGIIKRAKNTTEKWSELEVKEKEDLSKLANQIINNKNKEKNIESIELTVDKSEIIISNIDEKNTIAKLETKITPEDIENDSIIYESSDINIAEVDQNGIVTPKSGGTVTIYCKSKNDNDIQATCEIKVEERKYLQYNGIKKTNWTQWNEPAYVNYGTTKLNTDNYYIYAEKGAIGITSSEMYDFEGWKSLNVSGSLEKGNSTEGYLNFGGTKFKSGSVDQVLFSGPLKSYNYKELNQSFKYSYDISDINDSYYVHVGSHGNIGYNSTMWGKYYIKEVYFSK